MLQRQESITRKEALKKIGKLTLGLPIISSQIPNIPTSVSKNPVASDRTKPASKPNIVRRRKSDKLNVLWITAEGVPLSVLSCYGSRIMRTPNIDRIANEGMLFRNAYCTNALCAPSRATLLTGKYNHLCGTIVNPYGAGENPALDYFDPAQETFAKILRRAGYKTGLVGKWHLNSGPDKDLNPGEAGFDYFVYKRGSGGPYYDPTGFHQNQALGSNKIQQRKYKGYITDTFTDLAIKGIEKLKEPFFMAVQYFNVHWPFDPPHKYSNIYDDVHFPEPGTFWDDYSGHSTAVRDANIHIEDIPAFNPSGGYTKKQTKQFKYQHLMRHFLGTLKSQDDNIGRLLEYLDKTGLSDNTIVVYTGDHGYFLGEHGFYDKRLMFEEAIRVPWIIRYPDAIKPGSTSNALGLSIDNAPTILDMLGLDIPQEMQGESLVPIFEGNAPENWRTSMYYHFYEDGPPYFWAPACYGVRTDRYKLINYYKHKEWALYDLERDPDEIDSLIKKVPGGMQVTKGYENTVKDLLGQLKGLRKKYKDDTGSPVNFWEKK